MVALLRPQPWNRGTDPARAAATALTLTGPTTSTVGSASSAFTVSIFPVGSESVGAVTVTPDDASDGGTFTPSTVLVSGPGPTATFTYTAASAGTKAIGITNSGSLSNPADISLTASVVAPTWDATLGFTVGTLPTSISEGSFALIASMSSATEAGLFANHMGAVYMPAHQCVWFFGNETHSSVSGYGNAVYHIDLNTGTVYRDYAASTFLGEYRIDADGIPWADAAHTKPWAQHGFAQSACVSDDEWVFAYPTLSHANYFFGGTPTYVPTYEGSYTVSTYKYALWYYNCSTGQWRVDMDSAASANTAGIMGTGYGLAYSPTRGSLMGAVGGNWRELNITTYARESSAPAIAGGNYNSCACELDDGRVVVNAGGVSANTNVFSIVDPDAPGSFVNVAKPAFLSGYSCMDTAWIKTAAGNVVGFVKDQVNNQLRAVVYDPVADSWSDTGHTLSVGATGAADGTYWTCCCYASDFNTIILAGNFSGLRRVWGYKPAAGI